LTGRGVQISYRGFRPDERITSQVREPVTPDFPLGCPCGELCAEGKTLHQLETPTSRKTKFESVERFA